MKQSDKPFIIFQYGIYAAGLFVVYKTLKGIGLIKSGEQQAAQNLNNTIEFKDWTTNSFYKKAAPTGYNVILFNAAGTQKLITDIYNSAGIFNDCEECIKGSLKSIKYKTQYSWLAYNFYLKYGKDMTAYIKNYFNADELYDSWLYLENLPTYKKI